MRCLGARVPPRTQFITPRLPDVEELCNDLAVSLGQPAGPASYQLRDASGSCRSLGDTHPQNANCSITLPSVAARPPQTGRSRPVWDESRPSTHRSAVERNNRNIATATTGVRTGASRGATTRTCRRQPTRAWSVGLLARGVSAGSAVAPRRQRRLDPPVIPPPGNGVGLLLVELALSAGIEEPGLLLDRPKFTHHCLAWRGCLVGASSTSRSSRSPRQPDPT